MRYVQSNPRKTLDRLTVLFANRDVRNDFAAYWMTRLFRGRAVMRLRGLEFFDFPSLTEYRGIKMCMTDSEYRFVSTVEIEEGAILDVGASYGIWSMLLARRFPGHRVFAFEPHPVVYRYLARNVEVNGCRNVETLQMALSSSIGKVFFDARETGSYSSRMIRNDKTSAMGVQVEATTLDEFVAARHMESVAFLKIDVEGFEVDVLNGARKLLRDRKIGVIVLEVCPGLAALAGFESAESVKILERAGYSLMRIVEDGLKAVSAVDAESVDVDNWVARAG